MSEQPLALRLADALAYGFTARSRDASAELRRQHSEIDELKAKRDAVVADAERYRWLRDHMWAQSSTKIYALPISWEYSPDVMAGGYMDAAIDAARGGQ